MRSRLLTLVASMATVGFVLAGASSAWAADSGGENTANAQASGGTLTVSAGHTYWTPPATSSWATPGKSDPPQGTPNPNQPYGCTYTAGGPSVTASLGVGGPHSRGSGCSRSVPAPGCSTRCRRSGFRVQPRQLQWWFR